MKKTIYNILSFLVFPFQNSKTIRFFRHYLPFGEDGKTLYFSLYGEMCATYAISNETTVILNKPLLEDFRKRYKMKYLSKYLNAITENDVSISEFQQMHFFIMLMPGLFVEYDSVGGYSIYYNPKFEETELQHVLRIFEKNRKETWPRRLTYIKMN